MSRAAVPFWDRVDQTGGLDACWPWTGRLVDGYGAYWDRERKRDVRAHRHVGRLFWGDLPSDVYVLHSCDNRACCNPLHLYLGDHAQNMRDLSERNPDIRGERAAAAKLTDKQVEEVRAASGSLRAVGRRFGISHTHVRYIRNGYRGAA